MTDNISSKLLDSFKAMLVSNKHVEVKCVEKTDKQADVGAEFAVAPAVKKEAHPYLRKVKDEHSFKLKTDHSSVVSEVLLIEGLCEELKKAPDQAIVFHMNGRNDFAAWIKGAVGDWYLGSKVDRVQLTDPSTTKANLVRVLEDRIYKLKTH